MSYCNLNQQCINSVWKNQIETQWAYAKAL